jgi:hypothetical protein
LSRCAIEPAESPDGKKASAEAKDYDSGFGMVTFVTRVSFFPEPAAGREPPALLAFFDPERVSIGCSLFAGSWVTLFEDLSLFGGGALATGVGVDGLGDSAALALNASACAWESLYRASIGHPLESSEISCVYIPFNSSP